MKPLPPLLLGAALLFWGWQAGFLLLGAVMALVLECGHLIQVRWELSSEDFNRIWTLCTLLLIAAALYAFTVNEGPMDFLGLFQNPNFVTQRNAGTATARTAASLLRWLPMVFFPLVAAQTCSSQQAVPLETVSLILRRRWKKARQLGQPLPSWHSLNISPIYFGVCLFAASIHVNEGSAFFWGLSALLAWALWARRSPRFGVLTWACAMLAALGLAFLAQHGIGRFQRYLEDLHPQWLSDLARSDFDPKQSKTTMGQIGKVKRSSKIIIRLQAEEGSRAPARLRQASYRTYKVLTWYAGEPKDDFEYLYAEPDNTSWTLVPGKTNTAAVSIACYLPGGNGLLPVPQGTAVLGNLPASVFSMQTNGTGAVLAEGPGLAIFEARYGPGATFDAAPDKGDDLSVPPKEVPALEQVISELQLRGQNQEQAARSLSRFFQSKFDYSLWQDRDPLNRTNETPLSRFLLRSRKGHCEYFATATVLLLRQLHFPARYAVGYAVHETSGKDKYVVRQRDAHAWCLVWNEKHRFWEDLDTTPASWFEAEADRASALQWLSDLWSRLAFEFSKWRWGQSHLRQYILWALVPVIALLLFQILFRTHRERQRRKQLEAASAVAWPGLDSEFYALERLLVQRGLLRQASEPLAHWLQRVVADPAIAQAGSQWQELLRLHYRYRFDPAGLEASEREALRKAARACAATVSPTS